MISMKLSPAEQKENGPCAVDCEPPEYPWGLCLDLDDEALAKLGVGKLEAGQVVNITARAKVTRTSEYTSEKSGKEASAGLQITDMEVAPDAGKSAAEVLYGA